MSLHSIFQKTEDNPTVTRLLKSTIPILETTLCIDVLEIFLEKPNLFALPVTNQENIPTGIVDRHSFVETFIKPYTKEIYGKRPISGFMNPSPIIVDKETSIDDIARIIIDAGMQHMVSGFIATDEGRYLGIANGHDLLNEITERKQANLFYLAHYDQLTKLPNRALFMDRLTMAITECVRHQTKIGLLFIDLDKFKHFNDSMGHGFGDKLLNSVAAKLLECARESDTVARLSGDEFTILLDNISGRSDINSLCERIVAAMKQPLNIMGREIFITASIGAAICPEDGSDAMGLLVKADAAMYAAKRSGRNNYRHYIEGMSMYSYETMNLETDLRTALEKNEFVLFYQPQIEASTGNVIGSEALIRWQHPERGLLSPYYFIDIAETTGLIVPIGQWILEEACRQHIAWIKNGLPAMSMAVNISALQFYQEGFSAKVLAIIKETGIEPRYLELELTESMFMQDAEIVLKTLHELHELGVKLAIDDFGTGYSNLGYLKRFPIDRLKVDQSFIRNIEREPINAEIVKAIAALGKSLSLELVAEGVETDSELALAESSGCQIIQGFRYSKPLPADDLESWIKNNAEQALALSETIMN